MQETEGYDHSDLRLFDEQAEEVPIGWAKPQNNPADTVIKRFLYPVQKGQRSIPLPAMNSK